EMTNNCDLLIYPLLFEFYSDDAKSLQQEIHLHNQFDFTVKFKVLTTAPKKYTVSNPEGSIPPKTSVELIVKHSHSSFGDSNSNDTLRVKFYHNEDKVSKRDLPLYSIVSRKEHVMSQMMGKSFISSTYSNDSSEEKYMHSSFSYGNSLNDMMASQNELIRRGKDIKKPLPDRHKFYADQIALYNGDNVNYLVIIIGLICLTILFLPNYIPESQNVQGYLPAYLHVSYEIKLFCSFILGMVTMVILKN
ncbi:unnamed protein product, partial [Brachionus calyciflorus]